MISEEKTFFEEIVDYYFVTEFQNRGTNMNMDCYG